MSAITIRNLPDSVHNELRQMAASGNLSVEALVRNLLGQAARAISPPPAKDGVAGFADANLSWPAAAPASQPAAELWGALRGCVQVPPGTDLTAPVGEAWKAER